MFCNFPSISHHWNKWEVTDQGKIMKHYTLYGKPVEGSEKVVGQFVEQRRVCQLCGKIQLRREESKL